LTAQTSGNRRLFRATRAGVGRTQLEDDDRDLGRVSDGPQQLSFEHEREQQVAVSVLVEEHGELVAVVALNGAFAPALAQDAGADREWLGE